MAVGVALAVYRFWPSSLKPEFYDYNWSAQGLQAPYSFCVKNPTDKPVTVLVLLVAETAFEGNDGVTFQQLGRARHEIPLQPREQKKIDGAIQLSRAAATTTRVSKYVTAK